MSVPERTPLQAATAEFARSLRDRLTDDEYCSFTTTAVAVLVREADRLALGDVLRAFSEANS